MVPCFLHVKGLDQLLLSVMVEVLVARFDHLGYQLEEGVRSEVVGMAILHGSADKSFGDLYVV